uniref:hypothetical protein n=1 Tax=Rhizorhabdus sp. TaxID=1968843 RepID=UPI001B63FF0F
GVMETCYSINGTDFDLCDKAEVLSVLEDEGLLKIGATYHEMEFRRIQPKDLFSAEDFTESIAERLFDTADYCPDGCPPVTRAATEELENFVWAWIDRNAIPDNYWICVSETREKHVTTEDLLARGSDE